MICDLVVGDRVACVSDAWNKTGRDRLIRQWPIRGQVLVVRSVVASSGSVGLAFEEIRNPVVRWVDFHHEAHFDHRYFRRVRPTDISSLRRLCAPSPELGPSRSRETTGERGRAR